MQVGISDGGEVNLGSGFGETSPSHSAEAVASLPCSEDLIDPPPHAMDWLVPLAERKTVCPPLLRRWLALHYGSEGYSDGPSRSSSQESEPWITIQVFVGIDVESR